MSGRTHIWLNNIIESPITPKILLHELIRVKHTLPDANAEKALRKLVAVWAEFFDLNNLGTVRVCEAASDSVIVNFLQIHLVVFHLFNNVLRQLGDLERVRGEGIAGRNLRPLEKAPALLGFIPPDMGTPILFAPCLIRDTWIDE